MSKNYEGLPQDTESTTPEGWKGRPRTVFEALARPAIIIAGDEETHTVETQKSHIITGTGPEGKADTDADSDERKSYDSDD